MDIDFFVEPTPGNIAALRSALRDLWDDPEIDAIRAEDLAGEYPVVRYGPPDGSFTIDIMSGLGTAFSFADIESQEADAGNLKRKFRIPDDADR